MRFRPEVDYYEILQVHPRASQEMVKKAYRTLMGEMGGHPDVGGDEERAKLINEAYTILGDPDLRRAYDRARSRYVRPDGRAEAAGPYTGGEARAPGAQLDALSRFMTRVILSAIVVAVGMMIARVLENPIVDVADLVAMIAVLLRLWGRAALLGGR